MLIRGTLIPAILFGGLVWPQTAEESGRVHELPERPVYRVDVVEKMTVAVNYRHRSGATRIDFKGTPLTPQAEGQAKVEGKKGYIEIEARFQKMKPAIAFGAEYLTYVLWAITPEGRAANLGEIVLDNGRGKLNVTTELQVFGLIVTAEPYFAVRQPSDLVVLENEIRPDTKGKFEVIDAKYELLKRGEYEPLANPLSLTVDPRIPLELYEARNAVQIARSVGALEYAEDTFLKAERALRQAEAYHARNAGRKPVAMLAREAVQTAEDARELTVRRREQEALRREREEAARREAAAKAAAEEEARRRAEAERLRQEREEAERLARARAREAEEARKRMEAEVARLRKAAEEAEREAQRALELLKERTASFAEERAQWELDRQRREEQELERQRRLTELQRAELRVRIYSQLSRVLFIRDTDEGLQMELPPELFDPGRPALTAEGRKKLATVAGVLLAYPQLTVEPSEAEGVEEIPLDRARASAAREYLLGCGLVPERLWTPVESELPANGAAADGGDQSSPEENPVNLLITGDTIRLGQ